MPYRAILFDFYKLICFIIGNVVMCKLALDIITFIVQN